MSLRIYQNLGKQFTLVITWAKNLLSIFTLQIVTER